MPLFKFLMKDRRYYVPDEYEDDVEQPEKQTQKKKRGGKFRFNMCTPSAKDDHESSTMSDLEYDATHIGPGEVDMGLSVDHGAGENVKYHQLSKSSSSSLLKVIATSVVPAESEKSIAKPPPTSSSSSVAFETAPEILSHPASPEPVEQDLPVLAEPSPDATALTDVIETCAETTIPTIDETPPKAKATSPSSPTSASPTVSPKRTANGKARGKVGLRSGNQIVHNAKSASPTGLRTKDHSKMVEMLEPKDKNYFIWLANFLREFIDSDPSKNDVVDREGGAMLFLLLFAAKIESTGGINYAASVISHLTSFAAGDPAMATKAAKANAPKVAFLASSFYRPLIDAVVNNEMSKMSPSDRLQECRANAKFLMGTKPKFAEERVAWISDFASGTYLGVNDCTNFEIYRNAIKRDKSIVNKIADTFDICKKGGDSTAVFKLLN